MKVRSPKLVSDLYNDLRDRRLLSVAIMLLVGIVAVPFLISSGEETPVGPPLAPPAQAGSADEASPVVLAEVPGLRDFEKRLDKFNERNPFEQQLTGPTKEEKAEQAAANDTKADAGSGSGIAGGSAESGGTTDTGGGSGSGSGSGGSGDGGGGSSSEEIILYSWRINVKIRVDGQSEKRQDVKQLEFVPGNKRPVLQFIQGNFDATEAAFVVSRSVESSKGDGNCSPNNSNCEFILLKEGQVHRFTYEPDGRVYAIKLTKVKLIEERIDPSKVSPERLRKLASQNSALGG